ncbi:aminopeptidase N [bacterium A37T11]|nr:aminopeptidase N [bacterium A37T11]
MKYPALLFCCLLSFFAHAQTYRASDTKINDVVSTRLDVRFDYDKSYLYGKAWITLKPHFYATDSLTLDAKGMDIKEVLLIEKAKTTPLTYTYKDSLQLKIKLNKKYGAEQPYTVFIQYTSKPDERKSHGSAAITDDKGLYFINPKGTIKDKPTQIWTQGETESNSVWFPTIDKPDQKSTVDITMTVPAKYVTLSNGLLVKQIKNADGTRTDRWKLDQPIAPYLFFMGVGDYAIVKDSYKGKPVDYYVEKEYASVARKIFGNTPEMIGFYAKLLGVDYVWPKYSQIVGRDYVSGAMENVTATLHQESAQQNARELLDGNQWEDVIAHELFHHWFGDLVTTESWSNLTVNESFANYSEYLWENYKYGKDAGDAQGYKEMQGYLQSGSEKKDLVRFFYKDKEDMFDAVSYNKGGRILHMLKHDVGDEAFFKALNLYLTQNKFGTGEAHQLRLAFEQVTGQDLNWFWNQWYFGAGHPVLDISYGYDSIGHTASVTIAQQQEGDTLFRLPIDIDFYLNKQKKRYSVVMDQRKQTFTFPAASKPDLINVDGDKVLLAEKNDHKSMADFMNLYKLAGGYVDRKEAISYAAAHPDENGSNALISLALNDPFHGIRSDVLQGTNPTAYSADDFAVIERLAKSDPNRIVRSQAVDVLGYLKDKKYEPLFLAGVTDSSYSVAGASLQALAAINRDTALSLVPKLSVDARGRLATILKKLSLVSKSDADFDQVYGDFADMPDNQEKADILFDMVGYLGNLHDTDHFKKLTNEIVRFRDVIIKQYPPFKDISNQMLSKVIQSKKAALSSSANAAAEQDQINYLQGKIL